MNSVEIPVLFQSSRALEHQLEIMKGLIAIHNVDEPLGLALHDSDILDDILLDDNVILDIHNRFLGEFAVFGCFDNGVLGELYPDSGCRESAISEYLDIRSEVDSDLLAGIPTMITLHEDERMSAVFKYRSGIRMPRFADLDFFDGI